jgi:hypothetical protein
MQCTSLQTLYVGAVVLKPYDVQCTSLETLYVGAAVLHPYDNVRVHKLF